MIVTPRMFIVIYLYIRTKYMLRKEKTTAQWKGLNTNFRYHLIFVHSLNDTRNRRKLGYSDNITPGYM